MATNKRREKQVEQRIVDRAREHSGTAYKFTSPGRRAVPDRLIVCPCTPLELRPLFIEAKRPGEVATKPQEREHKKLRARGATVFVADDYDIVDSIFESICDGSCK
jgi:hypothetical protein